MRCGLTCSNLLLIPTQNALPSHPTSFSGGLTTAAGGRGWGAWVRPGGKGASDKGTLCRANFFQDVKAVTIDNPDLGGHQGQGGSLASNPGQHSNKHRKKALTCPPPNLQTEPNWRERRTEGDLGSRAEGGQGGRHGTEGRENLDEEQKAKDRPEGQRLRQTKS